MRETREYGGKTRKFNERANHTREMRAARDEKESAQKHGREIYIVQTERDMSSVYKRDER